MAPLCTDDHDTIADELTCPFCAMDDESEDEDNEERNQIKAAIL